MQPFFSDIKTAGKLLIVFVRLTFGKKVVGGFTGWRQKSDTRYEFDLKLVLKSLKCKQRFLHSFLIEFSSNNQICYWFCQIDIAESWGLTDLPGHDGKITSNKTMIPISHQRYKGGNRDYCSHFSVTFEMTGKFLIVFCKIDIGKSGGWSIYWATTGKWRRI